MASNTHVWNFATIGGVKRVTLESGSDLVHLHELDQKLWTALSCPVENLEIDRRTLELIDTDKNGQIRVPEILAAVKWVLSIVRNPGDLLKEAPEFPLSAINNDTEQGKLLLDSAKAILRNLGKENATSLTVDDTSDLVRIFGGTRFNGDGVITEDTVAGYEDLMIVMQEIMRTCGFAADRCGKPGITHDILQLFFDECQKYAAWNKKQVDARDMILPLGDDTPAAYAHYRIVKPKVDDFFLRCRLAAFDGQSTDALNLQIERVKTITDKNLSGCLEEIATYPIATIAAGDPLPLSKGVNPAWEGAMAAFRTQVVLPIVGQRDNITEVEWNNISQRFEAYEKWLNEKEGTRVETLGLVRITEILAGTANTQLHGLIEQDKAVEAEANSIMLVDQLVRYYRDLFTLLKNFVTFSDFYTPGPKAVFQAGTLYIDQRSCELCVRVRDMGKQGELAQHSGMYLIYCDCTSKTSGDKKTILAALTNGDVDDLRVGRNAVFYDRNGVDWDATIVKITENPTSIRQAFFAPYRRVSRFVEAQINKAASAADEKSAANLTKGVEDVPAKVEEAKAKKEASQSFDVAKFAGIFAAIGLAVGAIGSMLTAVFTGFLRLTWWQMPIAVAGTLLLISGPSMILAYMKLRKRNLAPILDANGWAINARVKINIQFGRMLTSLAVLPYGAHVNFSDPFSKKKKPIVPIVMTLLAIGLLLFFLWKNHVIKMPF